MSPDVKYLNFDIFCFVMVGEINMVCEKTLSDLVELFLERERARNLDTTLKLMIARTEVGAEVAKGRIEYVPLQNEKKLAEWGAPGLQWP
jgi:hypothetical protein